MKKYVKPDVHYENFELSVGVASCAIQLYKDGSYKGYYGSDKDGEEMGQFLLAEGGFGNTTACTVVPEIYGYYGGGETMLGS